MGSCGSHVDDDLRTGVFIQGCYCHYNEIASCGCGVIQFDIKTCLHAGSNHFDRLFDDFFCRSSGEFRYLRNDGGDDAAFDLVHRDFINFQHIFQADCVLQFCFGFVGGQALDEECLFPSTQPRTILVLPMSIARIIIGFLLYSKLSFLMSGFPYLFYQLAW